MRFRFHKKQIQKGFTLIEILVVVAIIGFSAVIIANWGGNINDSSQVVRDKSAKEDLRVLLRVGLDCASTVATMGSGQGLLKGKGGRALGEEKNGETIIGGRWHLRLAARSPSGVLEIKVTDKGKSEANLFERSVGPTCP